ncbi:MAG: ABC transporter ATP-binding protein, partial [Bacilli bacterium]
MSYDVEMHNITKRFGEFTANEDVTLQLKEGEIHALLGENGAGKSTLMNILFGLYQPEVGEIWVKGKKVNIKGPNDANDLGIGMVHQHFMLVQPFTVTENIILGSEPTKAGLINIDVAAKKIEQLSKQYGLDVDPYAKISDISVGMQQRVEILKTLYKGTDIIIFDEPTAVLTPQEISELIGIMRNLIKEGKSIILITHKLKEIMAVSDRVTVIRRGKVIDTVNTNETDSNLLAEMMVGREVSFKTEKAEANPSEPILTISNVSAKNNRGIRALNQISFDVKAGEILGIAGVDGNGQSELIDVITGLRKAESGSILFKGKDIMNKKPRLITEKGVAHIPEDRHKRGLVLDFTVSENIVLQRYYTGPFSRNGFLQYDKIDEYSRELIKKYDVRTQSERSYIRSLSGGNQQKVIIAREMDRDPDLL